MKNTKIVSLVALLVASATAAQAQLRITEVESSEASGSFAVADWFELSNLGASPIDITGYRMDDNSDSFASSVPLLGITSIGAGESVVFFEITGSTPLDVQGFKDWWAPDLGSSVQIGTYSGSGVGLSSNGDGVNIFDMNGNAITGVTFGSATAGTTFGYDLGTGTFGDLSQSSVPGTFTSGNGDIGSPGVIPVPEPATFALAALGLMSLVAYRRSKNRQA